MYIVYTLLLSGFPQYLLYRSLGESLVLESPPKEDCQSILNMVWKYITELTNPNKFMHCVEIWIQFTAIHFSVSLKFSFEDKKVSVFYNSNVIGK